MNFILQSVAGRNRWYSYLSLVLACILLIIGLNALMNQAVIPFIKSSGMLEQIGKDNITYIMIFFVFALLTGLIGLLHAPLHQRVFATLINAEQTFFRLKLYGKGMLQWGILLLSYEIIIRYLDWEAGSVGLALNFDAGVLLLIVPALFFQTLFEEILFRGYLLQNIGRKFASRFVPTLIVSVLFAFAHFGYGIESLLSSFLFSVVLTLITFEDNGIERAAGIHFANNFILLSFFVEVEEVTNATFDWTVNWQTLLVEAGVFGLLWLWVRTVRK